MSETPERAEHPSVKAGAVRITAGPMNYGPVVGCGLIRSCLRCGASVIVGGWPNAVEIHDEWHARRGDS